MGFTDHPFTPSELILLQADKFAPEAKLPGSAHQLLCSEGVVSGPYLATVILAASILANVDEGALNIEIKQQKKKLFGAASSQVFISPIGQPPSWNGYTLESAVLFAAGQLFAVQGEYSVQNVVHTILIEDRKSPWEKVIETVEWGLASSNWLMPVEGEAASIFSTPFICPEKVRELAFGQSLAPVKQLLADCKNNTPEIWSMMLDEIEKAFTSRQI